jgi:hypothetical protein
VANEIIAGQKPLESSLRRLRSKIAADSGYIREANDPPENDG